MSFSTAFFRAKESKRQDAIAKQQAKLIEMQLQGGQRKLDAQTTLADIMTGTLEEFQPAEPELTPGGREIPQFTNASKDPMSLIDILSGDSPEGQLAAIQSGVISGGDLLDFQTDQDRLAAQPDFGELFGQTDESGNPMFVPSGITIDADGRPAQQFGLNPEFNTRQQDDFSRLSLSQLTSEAIEIMDIESELAGSLLESGFPFGGQARTGQSTLATVGGALGFDTKAQKESVAKRDRVEKLYGQILGIRMQRLSESGESITNDKLAFLQSISPGTDKSPDANAKLLADFLQEELNKEDIAKTKIPADERKKVLDFIRKARSGEFLETGSGPAVDGPGLLESAGDFARSTMEQLQSIDVPSLPPEQIEAFEARFNQLKQQATDALGSATTAVKDADFSPDQKLLAKIALMKTTLAAASALEKVKVGIAKAADFAELTVDEIKQITKEDIKQWTEEQKAAFNKRRKELGL